MSDEYHFLKPLDMEGSQFTLHSDGTATKKYADPRYMVDMESIEQTRKYLLSEFKRLGCSDWLDVLLYETDPSDPSSLKMPYIQDSINIQEAADIGLHSEIVSRCVAVYAEIGTWWRPDNVRYFLDLDPRNWVYSPNEAKVYVIDYLKLDERFLLD